MNRSTSGVGRISHSWQPLIRARNSFFSLIRSEGKLSTVHVSLVPHLKVQCIPHPKSALDGLRHCGIHVSCDKWHDVKSVLVLEMYQHVKLVSAMDESDEYLDSFAPSVKMMDESR